MGRIISFVLIAICIVYLGTHPQVVRWGFGVVTAPLNRWMDNPHRKEMPLGVDKQRSLEDRLKGRSSKEKRARAGKAGKAEEKTGARAVAVQSARGL